MVVRDSDGFVLMFVSMATGSINSTGAVSVAVPRGVEVGDTILVFLATNNGNGGFSGSLSGASGLFTFWTVDEYWNPAGKDQGTNYMFSAMTVWSRTATAQDRLPGVSYTFSHTGSSRKTVAVLVYRNVTVPVVDPGSTLGLPSHEIGFPGTAMFGPSQTETPRTGAITVGSRLGNEKWRGWEHPEVVRVCAVTAPASSTGTFTHSGGTVRVNMGGMLPLIVYEGHGTTSWEFLASYPVQARVLIRMPDLFAETGNEAWWEWTAPETGVLAVDTEGTGTSHRLQVYQGDGPSPMTYPTPIGTYNIPYGAAYSTETKVPVPNQARIAKLAVQGGTTYKMRLAELERAPDLVPGPPTSLFVGSQTFISSTQNPHSASMPGDLMLAFYKGASTLNTPSGWNILIDSPSGVGGSMKVFWRINDGTQLIPATGTIGTPSTLATALLYYRYVSSSPIKTSAIIRNAGLSTACPNVTVPTQRCYAVDCYVNDSLSTFSIGRPVGSTGRTGGFVSGGSGHMTADFANPFDGDGLPVGTWNSGFWLIGTSGPTLPFQIGTHFIVTVIVEFDW